METQDDHLIILEKINKSFPGVRALRDISFAIRRGDIHSIIGENGAGKSTLIKILSGAIQKDSGTIIFDGKPVEIRNSLAAKKLGIGTVYQEMSLVPSLNAVENMYLGEEVCQGVVLNETQMHNNAKRVLEELNVNLDLTIPVKHLSNAQQQMIEIARSLLFERKLIIMDEPTSSLSDKNVQEFFRVIRLLKRRGVTIVYISHKLEELKEISDKLTVMRDSMYIDTVCFDKVDIPTVISMMVGRPFEATRRVAHVKLDGEVVLEAVELNDLAGKVRNASFKLQNGMILGFAGLVGAGRTELMRMIFGADRIASGSIIIHGKRFSNITTKQAVRMGIAYLSEDRKNDGLLLKLPIRQNISIPNLKRVSKGWRIDTEREVKETEKIKNDVHIITPDMDRPAIFLSGGNQQKVAIGKWLFTDCDIIIFDEPTRGIDVGARTEIYSLMNTLVKQGKSIILISSDLNEIMTLSDEIITMNNGEITARFHNTDQINQEYIMQYMLGDIQNVSI